MPSNRPPEWSDVTDQLESSADETDRAWVVLYPGDYNTHMFDGKDNLAILVDHGQAQELQRLAEKAIKRTEGDDDE